MTPDGIEAMRRLGFKTRTCGFCSRSFLHGRSYIRCNVGAAVCSYACAKEMLRVAATRAWLKTGRKSTTLAYSKNGMVIERLERLGDALKLLSFAYEEDA